MVKPVRRRTHKGRNHVPDTAKERPQEGEVAAVGQEGSWTAARAPMDVKVGDKVIFAKCGGTEIKIDGEEYIILRQSDILAIK